MNFCSNCGETLSESVKFCANCGKGLANNQKENHVDGQAIHNVNTQKQVSASNAASGQVADHQVFTAKGNNVSPKKRKGFIFAGLAVVVAAVAIIFFISRDNPHYSKVDGISDDVYFQMVEYYFYLNHYREIDREEGFREAREWVEGHKNYPEAERLAEDYPGVGPMGFFPNSLISDYQNPNSGVTFSSVEEEYIEKLDKLNYYSYTFLDYDFHKLSAELKEDLRIKDKYDPFD